MAKAVEHFRFSSRTIGEDGSFPRYCDLYPVASEIAATGEAFHAEAHAHQLSRMIVVDRQISGVSHKRDAGHTRRDGFDHVVLQLLVSGKWIGGAPGAEREVRPGEIVLLDMARPQRNAASAAQLITINMPRDQMEETLPLVPALHGAILPKDSAQLLGEFMLLLKRLGGQGSSAVAISAGKAVAELAAGAFAMATGQNTPSQRERHFEHLRRERVELYIDCHLANTALDAGQIARELGVSRSVLYQVFQSSGGVSRYILARRLELLSRALRRHHEKRTIAELAFLFGFASESHCSKAFRLAYGVPPGEYRKQALREFEAMASLGGETVKLSAWHNALR
ncbi:helix-turn-helix domain-containing protein [Devosia sp. BK]|uniref:helix-turn-helix domain-containing protein n=1 Tax=Devosia sp. BK TaxID=2871706 RepID=UPI00293AAE67|nr:helix-turn-helix domain-containing protein [Devosia sp. BK]MDV3253350.1 helix-turn-helix domain-containing protein [Devosia sp. BK]